MKRPMFTVTGRVVYERKPHIFGIPDVNRIARAIFWRVGPDKNLLTEVIFNLSTYMLRIILDLFGVGAWVDVVYLWLNRLVGSLLERLIVYDSAENVAAFTHNLYYQMYFYLPEKDRVSIV